MATFWLMNPATSLCKLLMSVWKRNWSLNSHIWETIHWIHCRRFWTTSRKSFILIFFIWLRFSYSYMIDNIILLITGTLHQRPINELISKCHPLGSFEQMEAIHIASTPAELYNAVLVDTPLGTHFIKLIIDFFNFSSLFCWLYQWTRFGWNERWNHS